MFNEMFGLDGQVAVVKALQLPAGRLGTAASSWVAGLGCWTGLLDWVTGECIHVSGGG